MSPLPRSRIDALVHLLGDDEPRVLEAAWNELERLGDAAVPKVRDAAGNSTDPRVRRVAVRFLREWDRREVLREWVDVCRAKSHDLEEGMYLIARSEYPDMHVGDARAALDSCARVLRPRLRRVRTTEGAVTKLVHHLCHERGFVGNVRSLFDPDNAYIHRVIESRAGDPASLAVVYLLVARRLSIPLDGIILPPNVLLRYETRAGERFIDPFDEARRITALECARLLAESEAPLEDARLRGATDREMLSAVLGSLLRTYHARQDRRRLNRVAAMFRLLEP